MKKGYRYTLVLTSLSIGVLIVLLGYTVFSSWFYWALLPQNAQLAISGETGTHIKPFIATASRTSLPTEKILQYGHIASRIAFADQGSSQFLVMLPKIVQQRQAQEILKKDNWQSQRFGLMLIAEKGSNSPDLTAKPHLSSIVGAFLAPWQQFLFHNQAFSPPIIISANPGVITGLKSGIVATSQYQQGGIYLRTDLVAPNQATPGVSFNAIGHVEKAVADNSIKYNLLALQRKMLAYIPTNEKNGIVEAVIGQIGFTKTNDRLVKEIMSLPSMTLYQQGSNASIGIQEQGEAFVRTARFWVENEEAYNYPQRHAFKLPDGTLGYEMRPSKPNSNWVNIDTNCQYLKGKEKTWWICAAAEKAMVGNSEPAVRQGLAVQKDGYQQLHFSQLGSLQDKNNTHLIHISGKENQFELFIK